LAPEILRVLRPQGVFIVEMGFGQDGAVQALFEAAGAEGLALHPDLAGRKRALFGLKNPSNKPLGNRPANR
jgi:release factor glutamine methyltransferase